MKVSEIFLSLQGESTFIGQPTVFVRFYGCNMRCQWCDSKYSVEGGNYKEMSVREIYLSVVNFDIPQSSMHNVKYVCLTGGEPTIQKTADLLSLIEALVDDKKIVSIETDGGTDLTPYSKLAVSLVMDIKLPSSGMYNSMRWENLDILRPGLDQIKFVILDRADYDCAKRLIFVHNLHKRGFDLLFSSVMPERKTWRNLPSNPTGLDYRTLAGWLIEDRLPARFQPQLHKVIWPEKERGF